MGIRRGVLCLSLFAAGCHQKAGAIEEPVALAAATPAGETPAETAAPTVTLSKEAKLAPLTLETWVFEKPDRNAKKLGYLRIGTNTLRSEKSYPGIGCNGDWYGVVHNGFVCVGSLTPLTQGGKVRELEEATLDLDHKLVKALGRAPDLDKPMPYPYGFVRGNTALYNQIPNRKEQERFEFGVKGHRKNYSRLKDKWNKVEHGGANAVVLDEHGVATSPTDAPYPPAPNAEHSERLFGTLYPDVPEWLAPSPRSGKNERFDRSIPNISHFAVPDYAIFSGKVQRHAGLALIGSFDAGPRGDNRRFAVTLDGRLVPADKIKPHVASAFHGVAIDGEKVRLPFAFVKVRHAHTYKPTEAGAWPKDGEVAFRSVVLLTGKEKKFKASRYLETTDGRWVAVKEVAYVDKPADPPKEFDYSRSKWIDVSIWQQTLVAYDGKKPVYATLVSTGVDGMGDPKKTKSTVRGAFRIESKHVTSTMDADDISNHFELREVPWVQFFEKGYALHATYWHDDFGKPRSHGCVNLAPIDARWLFFWTTPELPHDWHGAFSDPRPVKGVPNQDPNMGMGTWVRVRG